MAPFILFDPFIMLKDLKIFLSLFILLMIWANAHNSSYFSEFTKSLSSTYSSFFPNSWYKGEGTSIIFFAVLLAASNLITLFAYGFTPFSHLAVTWSLGLFMWASTCLSTLLQKFKNKISHFAPMGTPTWLLPLLISVELVSEMIRPITLSVRLAANLTAGHIILFIASSSISSFLASFLLLLLETLVALVQPLVFFLLCSLYNREA